MDHYDGNVTVMLVTVGNRKSRRALQLNLHRNRNREFCLRLLEIRNAIETFAHINLTNNCGKVP